MKKNIQRVVFNTRKLIAQITNCEWFILFYWKSQARAELLYRCGTILSSCRHSVYVMVVLWRYYRGWNFTFYWKRPCIYITYITRLLLIVHKHMVIKPIVNFQCNYYIGLFDCLAIIDFRVLDTRVTSCSIFMKNKRSSSFLIHIVARSFGFKMFSLEIALAIRHIFIF